MPISLTAHTRRGFLTSSLIMSGAIAMPQSAWAAISARDHDHVSLLSDVHVCGKGSGKMAEHLTWAINDVLSLPTRPDRVMIAGDCAYLRGKSTDYSQYVRLIDPLTKAGMPLDMILGNHDHRDNFWHALPPEQSVTAKGIDRQAAIVPGRHANWFLMDSLYKTNAGAGELGDAQLEWLSAALDQHTNKPALIMLHHNPERDHSRGSLKDSDQLMAIARAKRNVKAMFFGHTHIWNVSQDRSGIHMVNLPATAYTLFFRSFLGWVDCRVFDNGAALRVHAMDRRESEDGRVIQLRWRV